ncbi:MAG: redoxin domain-containing protein [Marinifilaceae bacterium]
MRSKIFNLLLLTLFIYSCKNEDRILISGTIEHADKQMVYLEQISVDKITVIDSTKTSKKGEFKFKTRSEYPTFYNLRFAKGGSLTIVGAPQDDIVITGKQPGLSTNYWVDGSESSLWIKVLNFQLQNTNNAVDSLQRAFNALPQTVDANPQRIKIAGALDSVVDKQIKFSKNFIVDHATSLAAYYALYQKFTGGTYILQPTTDLHSYKVVASSLKALYPDSPYTIAILKNLEDINKQIRNQKFQDLIQQSENNLPDIALPNVNGDTISLSSLRGKYILLDFTTLSAPASKAYIEEMKSVYKKFNSKGLNIYMVCLDADYTDWKERVKEYGINWTVVCETAVNSSRALMGWNVKSIPANYIINKDYEIVGKDLTGRRLEERLTDIVK